LIELAVLFYPCFVPIDLHSRIIHRSNATAPPHAIGRFVSDERAGISSSKTIYLHGFILIYPNVSQNPGADGRYVALPPSFNKRQPSQQKPTI
jgi:hypothetical protein